ncbi:response regulator transcription factor [Paenibacillus dakarensis]|uniref:response regulator transcription factor n=1 Tax=Paenibacillus dakarensis TaxID=1527293 RepID=UPI0006D5A71B|nr:response regulator [Paenibacillus dakarensis]
MNLMIVEDEPRLRNSLAYNIPWEEHAIEVVGLAANGLEALQLAERKMPDLMLVDVQMPEMDGLTLINKLRKRPSGGSLLKIIILSGHDNFEFVQHAMEYGVSKYLLKPAGEMEILQAVLEARDQLRNEMNQWRTTAELERKWKEHLPYLQNNFMLNWVHGRYKEEEVLARSKELFIDIREDAQFAAAVVGLDPIPEGDTRFGMEDQELLRFMIRCLASELLSSSFCRICTDPDYDLLLLFIAEPHRDPNEVMLQINNTIVKLLSQTKVVLKLTASAGISAGTGGISDVSCMYAQAAKALQERVVYGHDIAIPYRDMESTYRQDISTMPQMEKLLEIALETADETRAMEVLTQLWEEGLSLTESSEEFHEAVLYMNSMFTRMMMKQGWRIKHVVNEDYVYFENIKLLNTRALTWSWLTRTVQNITAYMRKQRKSTTHQVVKEILSLIDQEIDQEITLHTVADRLYVNSSYLSRLFKQEMGVAFSTYVLEQKMERAKRVLQEGHKVYDAARLVGYRDVSYFTKVFRKYWGVNPGEFKS